MGHTRQLERKGQITQIEQLGRTWQIENTYESRAHRTDGTNKPNTTHIENRTHRTNGTNKTKRTHRTD